MRKKSEIEKMFDQDIYEKKIAGYGVYKRTGKGVKHTVRGIRNPADLLKGKEKREYVKASKIMTTNIYDKIIPRAEFDKLELHIQKNMYSYWYLTHGIKAIQEGFGCGGQTVYDYLDKLGIPRKGKIGRVPRGTSPQADNLRKAREAKALKAQQSQQIELITTQAPVVTAPAPIQAPIVEVLNGLNLKYNGIYKAEQIQKILSKLELLVEGEESEFHIEIKITEKG